MKVTILGTANSWGPNPFLIPSPAWPMTGTLANGRQVPFRKYRTSLLVEASSGFRILVDCGPDFGHQLREFTLDVVDAILLTHPHPDHIGGLDELNLYRPTGRLPIPTYASEACWAYTRGDRGFEYAVTIGLVAVIHLPTLSRPAAERSFTLGGITVTPFAVEHNQYAPGAVGFVFEETTGGVTKRVLYTGDLWAVSNPADPLFTRPLDVAIIECDRWSQLAGPAVGGGHMSFQEAKRMLDDGVLSAPRPKQVVFVHFGDHGPAGHGVTSTYQDWRQQVIGDLTALTWGAAVTPDPDAVIGYEGLVL